jgi:radical SAM protein with 4Fe4S-binding SPASM domain
MSSCHCQVPNFEFEKEKIDTVSSQNRLLSMEIEFSLRCNFRCPYCYVPAEDYYQNEISVTEIKDAICQAQELGAGKIIILGGEPTLYPHLEDLVAFMDARGLIIEMFTNGTGITADLAHLLHSRAVRVVMKMNTFDATLQNRLSGHSDAYRIIQNALGYLKAAGYPSENAFLAVSTVICRQNLAELPAMWTWLRDQGIAPYFEIITPQANAKSNTWLEVPTNDIKALFTELSDIDRERYGIVWDPQPPLAGNKCLRHQFSCVVTSAGDVYPCVGVNISLGNVREQKLADIIANSKVLADLKNYRNTIKGACGDCEKAESCYGCRGSAYQLTGDYLASDPLCWRQTDTT